MMFWWRPFAVSFSLATQAIAAFSALQPDSSIAQSSRSDKRKLLFDWIRGDGQTGGVGFVADCLAIAPSTIEGAGDGLFVTKDVDKGETLLLVPEDKIISIESAWSHAHLGEAACVLTDLGGQAGKRAAMAGLLGNELLGNENSYWYPYLRMLPRDFDHVLQWAESDVEALAKGSNVYEQVVKLRSDADTMLHILETTLRSLEMDSVAADAVRLAHATMLCRAFEDTTHDCVKFVPVLDMCQHSQEGPLLDCCTTEDGDVRTWTMKSLQAGQELFVQYDSQELSKFFPIYAFVPGQTMSGRELLEAKSPIFFPDDEQ